MEPVTAENIVSISKFKDQASEWLAQEQADGSTLPQWMQECDGSVDVPSVYDVQSLRVQEPLEAVSSWIDAVRPQLQERVANRPDASNGTVVGATELTAATRQLAVKVLSSPWEQSPGRGMPGVSAEIIHAAKQGQQQVTWSSIHHILRSSTLLCVQESLRADADRQRERKSATRSSRYLRGSDAAKHPSSRLVIDARGHASVATRDEVAPLEPDELLVTVGYCHNTGKVRPTCVQILASQPLTMLRDIIHCANDTLLPRAADRPAGYFFIERVFYDDLRATNVRLSDAIISWSRRHEGAPNLAGLSQASMHDTRIQDLAVTLGAPYLYMHHGDCEHVVVFQDVRLATQQERECASRFGYPCVARHFRFRRRKCMICEIFPGEWMSALEPDAPSVLMIWCDTCYRRMHDAEPGHGTPREYPPKLPYLHD